MQRKTLLKNDVRRLLGLNIKKIRLQKKLSQTDLAFSADIDVSTLSRLERGVLNVTIDTLIEIAKVLDVDLPELFENDK